MTPSITLWEAYLIESLRSKGMDNRTLLRFIEKSDIEALNDFDNSFDHTELIVTNNSTAIKLAIESNYKVKFISINGIKNLMGMKFGLKEGKNFQMTETKFHDVSLSNEQMKILHTMISPLWLMVNVRSELSNNVVDIVHSSEAIVNS
jgi:hypothetical protein